MHYGWLRKQSPPRDSAAPDSATESDSPPEPPKNPCLKVINARPKTFSSWWSNKIQTLDELQQAVHSDKYAFVGFDVDWVSPRPGEGRPEYCEPVAAVGWSYFPTLVGGLEPSSESVRAERRIACRTRDLDTNSAEYGDWVPRCLPRDMRMLLRRYGCTAFYSQVAGREASGKALREDFYFGDKNLVRADDVENSQDEIAARFREDAQKRGKTLMLVTYHGAADLRRMYTHLPKVGYHFSAWLDVESVLFKANPSKRAYFPPLAGRLVILGYFDRDVGGSHMLHCSGNDAVRTIALLEGGRGPISAELMDGLELVPPRPNTRYPGLGAVDEAHSKEYWMERFPLHATISVHSGGHLPPSMDSSRRLGKFVYEAGYTPWLVIAYEPSPPEDNAKTIRELAGYSILSPTKIPYCARGILVFQDETALDQCVSGSNGMEISGCKLVVERPISCREYHAILEKQREILAENIEKRQKEKEEVAILRDAQDQCDFGIDFMLEHVAELDG